LISQRPKLLDRPEDIEEEPVSDELHMISKPIVDRDQEEVEPSLQRQKNLQNLN